jgi:hypothetical protein
MSNYNPIPKGLDFNYITRNSEVQSDNLYRELKEPENNNLVYIDEEPLNNSFSWETCLCSILVIIIFIIIILWGYYHQ